MKTQLESVKFAGHGHYKITIQFRNERRSNKAIKSLINVVKRANNLN
jgi:hypothetical protein